MLIKIGKIQNMDLRSKSVGAKGAGLKLQSDDVPVSCAVPQDSASQDKLLPRAPPHRHRLRLRPHSTHHSTCTATVKSREPFKSLEFGAGAS